MQKPFCEDTLTITPKNNLINNNDNKDLPWCTEDTQHAQSIWWATVTMRNSDIKRGLIFLPNLHESWVKAVKTSLSYHSIKCTFLEIYVSDYIEMIILSHYPIDLFITDVLLIWKHIKCAWTEAFWEILHRTYINKPILLK